MSKHTMTPAQKRNAADKQYFDLVQSAVDNLNDVISNNPEGIDVKFVRHGHVRKATVVLYRFFPKSAKAIFIGETK